MARTPRTMTAKQIQETFAKVVQETFPYCPKCEGANLQSAISRDDCPCGCGTHQDGAIDTVAVFVRCASKACQWQYVNIQPDAVGWLLPDEEDALTEQRQEMEAHALYLLTGYGAFLLMDVDDPNYGDEREELLEHFFSALVRMQAGEGE